MNRSVDLHGPGGFEIDFEEYRSGLRWANHDVWAFSVYRDLGYGNVPPIRTAICSIRRKLGYDTDNPTHVFTEPRVGYRMAKADTPEKKSRLLD